MNEPGICPTCGQKVSDWAKVRAARKAERLAAHPPKPRPVPVRPSTWISVDLPPKGSAA